MHALSSLFRDEAQRRRWTLAQIAELSDIPLDRVQRVERDASAVAALDAARLCQLFGLSYHDAAARLGGRFVTPIAGPALAPADATAFAALARQDPRRAGEILADMLASLNAQRSMAPALPRIDAHAVSGLLLRPAPAAPIHIALQYPPLPAPVVRQIALAAGVIIAEDVAAYAAGLLGLAPPRDRQARLTLERLQHTPLDQMKFWTVAQLDTALAEAGIFFRLAWLQAARLGPAGRALVVLTRWHALVAGRLNDDWLGSLRAAIAPLAPACSGTTP